MSENEHFDPDQVARDYVRLTMEIQWASRSDLSASARLFLCAWVNAFHADPEGNFSMPEICTELRIPEEEAKTALHYWGEWFKEGLRDSEGMEDTLHKAKRFIDPEAPGNAL